MRFRLKLLPDKGFYNIKCYLKNVFFIEVENAPVFRVVALLVGNLMLNLAFDTTAASCSIALLEDDRVLDCFSQPMDFGQSELLMPKIKEIMEKNKFSFDDLAQLTVCTGPGSFTGVRAGISAARSFGIAKPALQVCGVNAFDSYLVSLAFSPDEIGFYNVVLIETKREDFYYQIFDENLKPLAKPSAGMREDIISQLRGKKVTMLGDGVERFLMAPTGLSLHGIKSFGCLPIENVGLCGYKRHLNKMIDFPKPVYLRAPDVCLKK